MSYTFNPFLNNLEKTGKNDIITIDGFSNFPPVGVEGVLYYDNTNNKYYYWNGTEYKSFDDKNVFFANSISNFPTVGESDVIYVSREENKLYRFDINSNQYVQLGDSQNEGWKVINVSGTVNIPPGKYYLNGSFNTINFENTFFTTATNGSEWIVKGGTGKITLHFPSGTTIVREHDQNTLNTFQVEIPYEGLKVIKLDTNKVYVENVLIGINDYYNQVYEFYDYHFNIHYEAGSQITFTLIDTSSYGISTYFTKQPFHVIYFDIQVTYNFLPNTTYNLDQLTVSLEIGNIEIETFLPFYAQLEDQTITLTVKGRIFYRGKDADVVCSFFVNTSSSFIRTGKKKYASFNIENIFSDKNGKILTSNFISSLCTYKVNIKNHSDFFFIDSYYITTMIE
ncbi:MAG: hypothetical protein NZZ41_01325 [Candidatus Dojkabacteria bacterium]|nr:hypothetical protein [Candidatus Dojkabacteria bacterium]